MKKLLAMLVAAAMMICMMPAMAFADEAPAEETAPAVTEEAAPEAAPVEEAAPEAALVEEAAPEAATVEEAAPAEEATPEAKSAALNMVTVKGSWAGTVLTLSGPEEIISSYSLFVNKVKTPYTFKAGANDLSSVITLPDGVEAGMVSIEVTDAFTGYFDCNFYAFKANVEVDKASDKDVNFEYAFDSVVYSKYYETEKWRGYKLTLIDVEDCEDAKEIGLLVNTITLKAGETSTKGYLVMGNNSNTAGTNVVEGIVAWAFKEAGNDGNYTTDETVFAYTPLVDAVEGAKTFAKFDSKADLQDALEEINDSSFDTAMSKLIGLFQEEEMSFTHELETADAETTVVKKGVQTGDNNELGLWMVVMAFAGVAAAAVALKRREN